MPQLRRATQAGRQVGAHNLWSAHGNVVFNFVDEEVYVPIVQRSTDSDDLSWSVRDGQVGIEEPNLFRLPVRSGASVTRWAGGSWRSSWSGRSCSLLDLL